ncbi:MAG TPA: alpha/beta hydrolase-fold protein [Solirubrobacteraceae bacterium]|nr:alpha/beta hydrolase-fold protein [Solirubrobacteraceae bacterium]
MRRRIFWRLLAILVIAGTVAAGLIGTYSYGQAYWVHRGFAPVKRFPHARPGRLETVHFYSRALHRMADYLVYLPGGYSRAQRYPVYYLLHGAPGSPRDFISVVGLDVRLANRISEHQLRPMLLVMPDGRISSSFSDSEWANTPAGHFESYVLNVVRDVDTRFSAIPSRSARVIAGYSAGAYGALNIALHHPEVFENVQSWSGYYIQTRKFSAVFRDASGAALAYNSPLEYAQTTRLRRALERYPLRVYMFTGRHDPDGRRIGAMARALRRSGAIATYNLFPGGHDWEVWYDQVDSMMLRASRMVSHPLPPSVSRLAAATRLAGSGPERHALPAPARRFDAGRPGARAGLAPRGGGLPASAWLGLLLAIGSAALINLGFMLQQRGLVRGSGDGLRAWLGALRSRTWLAGQGLGWLGFLVQIVAVALAPLSLVQAFAAGGLALSVPLGAGIFGYRVPRLQVIAVVAMAASLALLPIGVPRPGGGIATAALVWASAAAVAGGAVIYNHGGAGKAIAAGLFYGVADAAIKAVSLGVRAHGTSSLFTGWTLVAAGMTFVGFLAFQAALRRSNAISSISLMTGLATLTALVFGLAAFGESLGSRPLITGLHLLAIAIVLACVPVLAGAESGASVDWRRAFRGGWGSLAALLRGVVASVGVGFAVIFAVLTGTGLLYGLRGLGWLAAGPRLGDALPLLQLAGFDGQPLARVAAAWLLAGVVLGLVLIRVRPSARVVVVAGFGLLLVLFASEASFALARNLRLSAVLADRVPGSGAWFEGVLLAAGAALPGMVHGWLRIAQRAVRPPFGGLHARLQDGELLTRP